jgi:hypothetical protein
VIGEILSKRLEDVGDGFGVHGATPLGRMRWNCPGV